MRSDGTTRLRVPEIPSARSALRTTSHIDTHHGGYTPIPERQVSSVRSTPVHFSAVRSYVSSRNLYVPELQRSQSFHGIDDVQAMHQQARQPRGSWAEARVRIL